MNRGVRAATRLSGCAAALLGPSPDATGSAKITPPAHKVVATSAWSRPVRRLIDPESLPREPRAQAVRSAFGTRVRLFGMPPLRTTSDYRPTGDQPTAIETLADSLTAGEKYHTLVGATCIGKTATMAWT